MTKSHLHRRRAARRTGYDEGLAVGEAERNNLKGKNQSIVMLLDAARMRIQEIFDHLDDEGDRVYLGSTNHRDWLRDMLDHMDRWSFDAMLPKGDINKMEGDPYAEIRTQRARAETAEAEVKRLREALKPFAKFGGELADLKQRVFLQILVCPDGDDHADNYRPNFIRARTALTSTGGTPDANK